MKNINKINKFLSLALILSAATSQVAFCMNREQETGKLGEITQDVMSYHIFERLELNDLNNLSNSCRILNEMVNKYLETAITDSKRQLKFHVDLKDFLFYNDAMKMQKKMYTFIRGTNRVLTIAFLRPKINNLSKKILTSCNAFSDHTYYIYCPLELIIDKNNANLLRDDILTKIKRDNYNKKEKIENYERDKLKLEKENNEWLNGTRVVQIPNM